jgi:biotin-(acetyl-CoA carboxylase) ligase
MAVGIDEDGALLVKTETGTERVTSGSVEVPAYGAACA